MAQSERLVPSSQAKLDELFLHWLSLSEAQQYVQTLLQNARKGKPLVSIDASGSISPGAEDRGGLSPKGRGGMASPPPRSPTGRSPKQSPEGLAKDSTSMWTDGERHPGPAAASRDGEGKHGEDTVMAERQAPAVRKPAHASAHIPRFWNPKQPSKETIDLAKAELAEIDSLFMKNPRGLSKDTFGEFATTVCGFPSFFAQPFFEKLVTAAQSIVPRAKCMQWYEAHVRHKKPEVRLFHLLREGGNQFVTREDWKKMLAVLLDTHQGLDFLKATPEFQDRYLECVVERIYYVNNKACNDKMTLHDISLSNLVRVLKYVDEEQDINKVLDYFSYEHFYVLYCKFWELDTDHDFLLDRDDLVKLCNYTLTYRIVDRIFSGACRPLSSGVPDKLGYHDFIWLLLSEEDKTSDTAIAYWFRAIDLDADGFITPYEMEFFYKEQLHRMDCLAQEVVQFEDILCQMTDMVKPEIEGKISLLDLKRCKQSGVFFNVLFNLTKFIQYDQKDPTQIFNERATPELSDWDRYAKIEYQRLAMEEDQGELVDEWDAAEGTGFTAEP